MNRIRPYLSLIGLILIAVLLLLVFWPLLLILALVLFILYRRNRKNITVVHYSGEDLARDLFRTQISRKEEADIIDVNYTENDKK